MRHLRYFVAVAEAGSLTVAAERTLHTAQPSLSRQIRDLEDEVRVPLFARSARGVALTAAGRAFLDHARIALAQVDAAGVAARRAASPGTPSFALGFLTGHEIDWLPAAMRVLHDALPFEVTLNSDSSPRLAQFLVRGTVDLAFLRHEDGVPELDFRVLVSEPLVVVLPHDHPLASHARIAPRDLRGETLVRVADNAPRLRRLIDAYLEHAGVGLPAQHEIQHLSMAISLISSTRGVALLPAYATNFLPASVVSRPLAGVVPTIDLMLGWHRDNASPLLRTLLSRVDALVAAAATRPGTPEHANVGSSAD